MHKHVPTNSAKEVEKKILRKRREFDVGNSNILHRMGRKSLIEKVAFNQDIY